MPRLSEVRLTKRLVEAARPGECLSDNEARGFRLIVSPTGTRRFVASYRVGSKGKASMKALGSYPTLSIEAARAAAREVLELARKGLDPQASRNAPTVAELARVYLDEHALERNLAVGTVRDARALLAIVTAALGKRRVSEVTITDMRKLHGDVRRDGIARGTKGNYQANRLLAVVSKCFALALERGWRADNPCKGIAKFPEDQRWDNLSEAQVGRLLDACGEYEALGGDGADAVRLLLFTGARLREVLRAEWLHFELERGIWNKPSAHTKTKRQHRLELEGPALRLLQSMAGHKRHHTYLFPGNPDLRRKGAPVDIATGQPKGVAPRADLKRPWQAICALAGMEGVRLHDLRRTTASFMLSGGASLATVGKALGHTQASTTQRYATLAPSVQREGLRAAGEAMVGLAGRTHSATVLRLPEAANQ